MINLEWAAELLVSRSLFWLWTPSDDKYKEYDDKYDDHDNDDYSNE